MGKLIPFNIVDLPNHPQFDRIYVEDSDGNLGVGLAQIDQDALGYRTMTNGGIIVIGGSPERFTGNDHPIYDECVDLVFDNEQYRQWMIINGRFGAWLKTAGQRHNSLESIAASNDVWPLPDFQYGAFFKYEYQGELKIYLTRFRITFTPTAREVCFDVYDFSHQLIHQDQMPFRLGGDDKS